MPNVKANVIPDSKIGSRKVIDQMALPVGDTEVNLYCGNCHTMLIKGYSAAKFTDTVIRCTNCRKINEP